MSFYQRIRDLREDSDMTQRQVAALLGMQLTQYRRYETGERSVPADFIVAIAKLYKVSADYVLGLSKSKN